MVHRVFRMLVVACLLLAGASPWLQFGAAADSATPVVEEDPTATVIPGESVAEDPVTLTINGSEDAITTVMIDESVIVTLSSGSLAIFPDPECAVPLITYTGNEWTFQATDLFASYGTRFWFGGTNLGERITGCLRVDIVDPSIPVATPASSPVSANLTINGLEDEWLTFDYSESIVATFSSERLAFFLEPGCDGNAFGSYGVSPAELTRYDIDEWLGESFSVQGVTNFGSPVTTCRNINLLNFPTPTGTLVPADTVTPSNTPAPTNTAYPSNTPAPTITAVPSVTPAPTNTRTPATSPTATPTRITNIDANQCQTLTNAGLMDAYGLATPRDIEFTVFVQQVRAIYPAMSLEDITWLFYGQCAGYVVATPTATVTLVPTVTNTPTWRLTPASGDALFTICHWKPSNGTYIPLETNPSYILGFSDFMNSPDIIPPFTYRGVEYSQNWDAYGKDVLENECQAIPDPRIRICNWSDAGHYYMSGELNVYGVLEAFYQAPGHEQDIIPPFRTVLGLYPALNWNATTQAIWENGCQIPPETTPPPTNTPMPTVTSTTTPLPAVNSSKLRICHALTTGGYSSVVAGANGVKNGHLRKDENDIVPPFTLNGVLYSQNWTSDGRAIWNNGCVAPPS